MAAHSAPPFFSERYGGAVSEREAALKPPADTVRSPSAATPPPATLPPSVAVPDRFKSRLRGLINESATGNRFGGFGGGRRGGRVKTRPSRWGPPPRTRNGANGDEGGDLTRRDREDERSRNLSRGHVREGDSRGVIDGGRRRPETPLDRGRELGRSCCSDSNIDSAASGSRGGRERRQHGNVDVGADRRSRSWHSDGDNNNGSENDSHSGCDFSSREKVTLGIGRHRERDDVGAQRREGRDCRDRRRSFSESSDDSHEIMPKRERSDHSCRRSRNICTGDDRDSHCPSPKRACFEKSTHLSPLSASASDHQDAGSCAQPCTSGFPPFPESAFGHIKGSGMQLRRSEARALMRQRWQSRHLCENAPSDAGTGTEVGFSAVQAFRRSYARRISAVQSADEALRLLDEAEKGGFGIRGDGKGGEEGNSEDSEPCLFFYNSAIGVCGKYRELKKALKIRHDMILHGLDPNISTYNSLLGACDKVADWETALDLLREMNSRGVHPSVRSYTTAMSACEKARRWETSLSLLQEMMHRDLEPNIISYSSAISACAKAGQWERALGLLKDMEDTGIQPDLISYSVAISACEKGREWERALDLFQEMKGRGIRPDVMCYNAVLSACEKGRQWEIALDLFQEMKDKGIRPNVVTYSASISACEKGRQWKRTLELLREMKKYGIEPNTFSYNGAIAACERFGKWENALQLFYEMKDCGIEPNNVSYSTTVSACYNMGQYREALALVAEAAAKGLWPDFANQESVLWDLHHLDLSVSCMLLVDALLSIVGQGQHLSSNLRDKIIITGKGIGSGLEGPVLRVHIPQFLRDMSGPTIRLVRGNGGRFLLTKEVLRSWGKSSDFERFRANMMSKPPKDRHEG